LTPDMRYTVRTAGIINNARALTTKRGERMAVLQLDDGCAQQEVVMFADLFHDKRCL